jgi:hypothetical protein
VPGPLAVAVLVAPAGGGVGAFQDVAVEVGGPEQLELRAGKDQRERIDPGVLLGPGLLDARRELVGERVAGGCAPRMLMDEAEQWLLARGLPEGQSAA